MRYLLSFTLVFLFLISVGCGGRDEAGETDIDPSPTTPPITTGSALEELKERVETSPSLEGYFELGNVYTEQGKFTDAVAAYEEALKINPNHTSTLANMGVALYQLNRLSEAQEQFKRALQLDKNDAATQYLLGATYLQQKDLDSAEEQFKLALEIDEDLPEAKFGMAMLYQLRGDNQAAITALEEFLAGPPAQDPRARDEANRILEQLRSQQP